MLLILESVKREISVEEIEALVALTQIPCLGSAKIRALINRFGTAINAWEAETSDVLNWFNFNQTFPSFWEERKKNRQWEKNFELAAKERVRIIPYTSDLYPAKLRSIQNFPLLLYNKGTEVQEHTTKIALIGTRLASEYGRAQAEQIAQELSQAGISVVSGLARGIDTAAHKGAVKNGQTIAVLGSGLLNIYPRENNELAKQIAETGTLLSEFPLTAAPEKRNFLMRNRIVSGISEAVVLIEASTQGGAMHTMHTARVQGKKLLVLAPEKGREENFQGNHLLWKQGQASVVENAQDIIRHLETARVATEKQLNLPF